MFATLTKRIEPQPPSRNTTPFATATLSDRLVDVLEVARVVYSQTRIETGPMIHNEPGEAWVWIRDEHGNVDHVHPGMLCDVALISAPA